MSTVQPTAAGEESLLPIGMLNEFVYCPRLAYPEWTQAEFAHIADTVDGAIKHRRVDKPSGNLPQEPDDDQPIRVLRLLLRLMRPTTRQCSRYPKPTPHGPRIGILPAVQAFPHRFCWIEPHRTSRFHAHCLNAQTGENP